VCRFLFYFFSGVWNSSGSVVFFDLFFYRSLEQFRQYGVFCFIFLSEFGTVQTVWCFCLIFLSEFGTVPTVWCFLFYFSIGVWNSSDSVVFFALFFYRSLEQFRQCGIFCFIFLSEFGTVPTVWYFLFYFSIGGWNSSDSVVLFVLFSYRSLEQFRQCVVFCFIFLSEFGTVPTVWCFLLYFSFGVWNSSDSVVFLFSFSFGVWNSSDSVVLLFYFSLRIWNSSDSVVFLFSFSFGVWNSSDSVVFLFYFSLRVWNSSDSVVFLFSFSFGVWNSSDSVIFFCFPFYFILVFVSVFSFKQHHSMTW